MLGHVPPCQTPSCGSWSPQNKPRLPLVSTPCLPVHSLLSGFPLSATITSSSQGFFLAVPSTPEALSHAFPLPSGQLNPDYVSINYFLKIVIKMRNTVSGTVIALHGDRW